MLYNILTKAIGVLAIVGGFLYLDWTLQSLNWSHPFLALATYFFSVFSFLLTLILVINNWYSHKKEVKPNALSEEDLPSVAIIIPTWREPLHVLEKTIYSILNGSYPLDKLLIVVSDDAADIELKTLVHYLRNKYKVNLVYHKAPAKGSTQRIGEGKAGNLNSAYELIKGFDFIKYIETRDADDLVGDRNFLIKAVTELESNEKLAYVQTIKEAYGSRNDPFSNRERFFYHNVMLNKQAANAVFPCGSGLVWRKIALEDINGFSAWNLVEDVQSGIDALKKGWEGKYLPIIGAVVQVAPEDLQNVVKQRTTWAMDSLRMFFWEDMKGLSFKQKLQFLDAPLTYLFSIFMFLQMIVVSSTLITGDIPIKGDIFIYAFHVMTSILANFIFISALRRNTNVKMIEVIKSVLFFLGLGPQFLISLVKVLVYGKNRKPKYVVTRRENINKIYLSHVLPQIVIIDLILFSVLRNIQISGVESDWINIIWAIGYIVMYFRIIKLSWFNYGFFKSPLVIANTQLKEA
ncbi:glycosyltransferase [bacterium]|nr:glycosyltransferase [bacterium]